MSGLISNTLNWITDPADDNSTITQWFAGLVVILILSFLWASVVRNLTEG